MNNEIKGSKKKKPYPYTIKPFNLDWVKDVKALSRESILEFLRVEALLRSPKVHKLHEMGENRVELFPGIEVSQESEAILFKKYGITWEVLWGSHHSDLDQREDLLKPSDSGAYEPPVCDIKADVLNSSEKENRAGSRRFFVYTSRTLLTGV